MPSYSSRDIGLLVLRLTAGLCLAFLHGMGKVPPAPQFVDGVAAMGFPMPAFFAWAAGLAEFAGGLFLAAGLFMRPAAAFVAITMAVAAFVAHAGDPIGDRELPLVFLSIAVSLLLMGAGSLSVDAWWQRRKDR